jgi:hypothetical protein
MERFVDLVMSDEKLASRLAGIADDHAFAAEITACGIATPGELMSARGRPDGLGSAPWSPPVFVGSDLPPRHWLPVTVAATPEGIVVDWAWLGPEPLRAASYEDEIRRALALPFNRVFRYRTDLGDLIRQCPEPDGLEPDGFIFHMSRCGSTLVAQMLAALPDCIVVSEAPPVDAVLQLHRARDPGLAARALRAMMAALGRKRSGRELHYFVKLDAWHTLSLPLFRRAFPNVPWAFLYRDPVEVMVSQMRRRGIHMVPEYFPPDFYGIGDADCRPDEDYYARVLAAICQAAIGHHGLGGGLLLDYRDLPETVFTALAPHFGLSCDETERETMRGLARLDAKSPTMPFTADAAAKRRAATEKVRRAAERHLAPIYRRLEQSRMGHAGGEI